MSGTYSPDIVIITDGAGHYLQLPQLTTAERNALTAVNGMVIYNSTTGQIESYENGAWGAIASIIHAPTHIRGAADEIDGDKVDIDWNPTNYVPGVAPAQVTSVDELTAHLYGIDQALAGSAAHASTHDSGGSDQVHSIADDDDDTKIQVEEGADEDKIRMDVEGVEAFLLSDIGVLTLAKQSGASAYLGADQEIPPSANTKVILDSEDFDVQNEFDSTIVSSTATAGTGGTTLVDSGASFVAGDVGKAVWNTEVGDADEGKATTIAAYVSGTEVTLTADIGIDNTDTYKYGYARFTVKEAGKYMIGACCGWGSVPGDKRYITQVYKNGASYRQANQITGSVVQSPIVAFADVVELEANDYLELWAYDGDALMQRIRDGASQTHLTIFKIG